MARMLAVLLLLLSSSYAAAGKPRHSAPHPPAPTFDANLVNNPITLDATEVASMLKPGTIASLREN
jgi:hypothetical protein